MPYKKISADEAKSKLEKRKEVLRDTASGPAIVRAMKAPPSWDGEKRTARFIMSSESVDRYRDIVVQGGLDTSNFSDNPQALLFHNSRSWPIGNWSDITKVLNGRPKRTEGTLNFLAEGVDPDADRAAKHVAAGTIRTVSIGFIPDWDDVDFIIDEEGDWTGGFRFNHSELIECSLVPVPAQPDALVKSAEGDMTLAKELIEDILDNYAKTPEGLIIPRSAYEAAHLDVVGTRSTYILGRGLDRAPATFAAKDALKLDATTDEEAAALVGATVTLDPSNAENKDWPFDVLAKAEGEIVASYIVADGENKGVHALWVEFLTDSYSGMFRGIRAERFLLVPKGAEVVEPAPEEKAVDSNDPAPAVPVSVPVKSVSMKVELDASEAEQTIGRLSGMLEGLGDAIAKIFGRAKEAAPELVEPPAPEIIDAAKSKAADALTRIAARGL